jgi:hypothetical protein
MGVSKRCLLTSFRCVVRAGNLSARLIHLGPAVAPSLALRLQRMRGPNVARGIVGPIVHVDRALVTAVLAGCEQATDAMRRMLPNVIGPIGSSSLAHRERNQLTVIGSSGGTNVAPSGLRLGSPLESGP